MQNTNLFTLVYECPFKWSNKFYKATILFPFNPFETFCYITILILTSVKSTWLLEVRWGAFKNQKFFTQWTINDSFMSFMTAVWRLPFRKYWWLTLIVYVYNFVQKMDSKRKFLLETMLAASFYLILHILKIVNFHTHKIFEYNNPSNNSKQ